LRVALEVRTHGIVLGTERFEDCVKFYRDIIGLAVWYEKPDLVCLRFGDGYLMVETAEAASDFRKPNSGHSTMLRFNVADVEASAEMLRAVGVDVVVKTFDWGVVGTFHDPDGNPCELKNADDPFFA
jgi:lactoylglutathione lyase